MTIFKDEILKANKILCAIVVNFFTLFLVANAQNPGITTSINKQNILIGEPLQFKVEATFPPGVYKVNWLNIPDSINHFEVIQREKIDSQESNGLLHLQQIVTLTSFDSGLRTIPSFVINFDPFKDDTTLNLVTDSLQVRVSFSPMDTTKTFHDIKTIIEVKDEWTLWMWIAAFLSAVLLIFLVYYLFKNRRKKPQQIFTSKLSPLDEAIKSLDELQKEELLSRHETKQFHSRLSEIFKRYISRKTNFNLHNQTSAELLVKLNELNVSKENIGLAAGNLKMGDAVKFAKYIPHDTLSNEAFSNTKKVIQQLDQSILISKSDI